MSLDPEPLLEQLTPRGTSSDVRARVLAMVGRELEAGTRFRWQRWCGLAVAASLVLGIASNVWISWKQERRLAQLYGPSPIRTSVLAIAKDVESVTDKRTAQWLEQRFAMTHRPQFSLAEHIQQIERFLRDFETVWNVGCREKIQENSQDRSLGPGSSPGALADRECHRDLDHGLPA